MQCAGRCGRDVGPVTADDCGAQEGPWYCGDCFEREARQRAEPTTWAATIDSWLESNGMAGRCHRRLSITAASFSEALAKAVERWRKEVLPWDSSESDVREFKLTLTRSWDAE